jgi:hypothetical protein
MLIVSLIELAALFRPVSRLFGCLVDQMVASASITFTMPATLGLQKVRTAI